MTQAQYQKLWITFGSILAYYAVNAWVMSQGGNPILPIHLLQEGVVAGPLTALPICAALLLVTTGIGVAFARAAESDDWHARIPVVFLEGLDTSTLQGRVYQTLFLLVLVLIPAGSLIHFIQKVWGATVIQNKEGCRAEVYAIWQVPSWNLPGCELNIGTFLDDAYRIGAGIMPGAKELPDTVTWFPGLEPAVIGLLVGGAFVNLIRFLIAVYLPASTVRKS